MIKKFFKIFLLFSIHVNLFSEIDDEFKDYKEIKCTLRPILRLRDEKENLRSLGSYLSHPNLPYKKFDPIDFATTSNNWAGYVAGVDLFNPQNARETVKFVKGIWRVPRLARSNITTYCATWVGIDGFNNNTVEQVGTEQEFIVSNQFTGQFNYAWIELFPKDAQIIQGFPVNVGDVIFASVKHLGGRDFSFTIVNRTRKVRVQQIKSTQNQPQRVCSEWIVEAPFLNGVLPLGNFKTVRFNGCKTTIRGTFGTISNRRWQHLKINMVSPQGVVKATTTGLSNNGTSFSVNWKHR